MQGMLAVFVDHRMAGVVAALETDDHVGILGQVIDDPAFSFVAPLGAHDGCDWHWIRA